MAQLKFLVVLVVSPRLNIVMIAKNTAFNARLGTLTTINNCDALHSLLVTQFVNVNKSFLCAIDSWILRSDFYLVFLVQQMKGGRAKTTKLNKVHPLLREFVHTKTQQPELPIISIASTHSNPTITLPELGLRDLREQCTARLKSTQKELSYSSKVMPVQLPLPDDEFVQSLHFLLWTKLKALKTDLNKLSMQDLPHDVLLNVWSFENVEPRIRDLMSRFKVNSLSLVFTKIAQMASKGKRVTIGVNPEDRETLKLLTVWLNCLMTECAADIGRNITVKTKAKTKSENQLDVSNVDMSDIVKVLNVATAVETQIRHNMKITIASSDNLKSPLIAAFVLHKLSNQSTSLEEALSFIKSKVYVCCDAELDSVIARYQFYLRMTQ